MRISPQLLCPATSSGGVPVQAGRTALDWLRSRLRHRTCFVARYPKERTPVALDDRSWRFHVSFRVSGVCRDAETVGLGVAIPIV